MTRISLVHSGVVALDVLDDLPPGALGDDGVGVRDAELLDAAERLEDAGVLAGAVELDAADEVGEVVPDPDVEFVHPASRAPAATARTARCAPIRIIASPSKESVDPVDVMVQQR